MKSRLMNTILHSMTRVKIAAAVLLVLCALGAAGAVLARHLLAGPPEGPVRPALVATDASSLPVLVVEAVYPGANAQVVAETVAAPIEQQINGVEDQLSLSSQCTNDGRYTLHVTFKPGVNLKVAQVLVQNRVSLALPVLPALVNRTGVTVKRKSPRATLLVALFAPEGRYDTFYLSNYLTLQVKDELARVAGVGDVLVLGQQEASLRVWLDPDKLAARNLTATDVIKLLQEQNAQAVPDPLAPPGSKEHRLVVTAGRLADVQSGGDVVLKNTQGGIVRLKDVARIELGQREPRGEVRFNGKPAVALAIYPLSQAQAQEASTAVRQKMSQLRPHYPEGIADAIAFDSRPSPDVADRQASAEYLLLEPVLPDGASLERCFRFLERCGTVLRETQGVRDVLLLSENPFAPFQNGACILVRLTPAESRQQITRTIRKRLETITEGILRLRNAPGPYPIELAIHGPEEASVRKLALKLAERLGTSKKLTDLGTSPGARQQEQLLIDIDRTQAQDRDVALDEIFKVIQVYLGAQSVHDLGGAGRIRQVSVQGEAARKGGDLKQLKIRNARGQMVTLADLARLRSVTGPVVVDRLDGQPMVAIGANPASGVSPAEARTLCEELMQEVRQELKVSKEYRLTWLHAPPATK